MTKPKGPNILSIESIVQPHCIVTVNESGNEFLLEDLLGYGRFGMTFRARTMDGEGPFAIKFQALDRAEREASVLRTIQLVERCQEIVDYVDSGLLIQVQDPFGKINTEPAFEYRKPYLPDGPVTPEMLQAFILWQAGRPEAWQRLDQSGALIKDKEVRLGCIVMEFASGTPISKMHNAIEIEQAIELVKRIARGIAHMHYWGFIHGDLKPENIVVANSNGVKILDFSTAFREGQGHVGLAIATSFYSPINQHRHGVVNRYSDIYAIASIFYRLVTSHDPVTQYLYTCQQRQMSFFDDNQFLYPYPTTTIELRASVRKYWEHMPNLPKELQWVLCGTIGPELESIATSHLARSESALENILRNYSIPSGASSVVTIPGVIDFVPKVVPLRSIDRAPPATIQEIVTDLEEAHSIYQKRNKKELEQREKRKQERKKRQRQQRRRETLRQALWLLAGIFICAFLIYLGQLSKARREAKVFQATATAETIISQFEAANNRFEAAYTLHETAESLGDSENVGKYYQDTLEGYAEALKLYESVVSFQGDLVPRLRGASWKNASITCWNMSVIYHELNEAGNRLFFLSKSAHYVEQGFQVYPQVDDLEDILERHFVLGGALAQAGDFDRAIGAFEKCAQYLSEDSLTDGYRTLFKQLLVTELEEMDSLPLAPEQRELVNHLLESLSTL